MSIIVVVLFALCWLPYHIYFIVIYYYPGKTEILLTFEQPSQFTKHLTELTHKTWIEDLYMSIYWLAMSTTIINPMVYYTINSK